MKLKITLKKAFFLFVFSIFLHNTSYSQCFEIESILVDACDGDTNTEGLNEMVRFKVGNSPINTSNMSVDWPSNSWGGLIQNSTTASKVASLNASIVADGGCGQVLQPTNGVLPANATVILVTSYNFNVSSNTFGALTDTIYILFQNSNTITGHFGNYGTPATRTLRIEFGACFDTVTYNRSLLTDQNGQNVAADGATVNFTPSGAATYVNNGCVAPVQTFTVDAGTSTGSICAGTAVPLNGTSQGYQTITWSAPAGTGTIANTTSLTTTFTPSASSAGTTVAVTLTATNSCGAQISDIVYINVSNGTQPNFNVTPLVICTGGTVPTLNTTSPNGISGTWNPATISNTNSGSYVFTPNAGQCATTVTLSVTVTSSTTPDFNITPLTVCTGGTVPTLNTTSPNGVSGTWNPATISNTNSGNYTFTPNAGQCATAVTLNVTVTSSITPNFDVTPLTICSGGTVPTLNTTSPNGISGTWNPATISNTASGNYTFTPNAGQCASQVTLSVTITNSITPNFDVTPLVICTEGAVPALNTTSPNGISGTWNPATISNTASGNYIFTPNSGQCATAVTLNVTVGNLEAKIVERCTNKELILEVLPVSNSFNPNDVDYIWKDADGTEVGSNEATFNVTEYVLGLSNPTFPMLFTATVIGSCETTESFTITGISCNIPKGISPNGDGKNDEFDLTGLNVKKIIIFNRYGTKVYSKSNYTKEWTGKSDNGNELPDATYFYVIERDGVESITGWVQINRQRN